MAFSNTANSAVFASVLQELFNNLANIAAGSDNRANTDTSSDNSANADTGSDNSANTDTGSDDRLTIDIVKNTVKIQEDATETQNKRRSIVANEPGLIAFWDFNKTRIDSNLEVWESYFTSIKENAKPYPLYLRRSDDPTTYGLNNWPDEYEQFSYDKTGPFGLAPLFNQGHRFSLVPRELFENTPLNIQGNQSFSMITWIKFSTSDDVPYGKRHMIAGIWDEGDWSKYSGNRQYALFGGLLTGRAGTLFHISATGSASYPQSNASGSQYARIRSIAARDVGVNKWHALGVTFDHTTGQLTSYVDGIATTTFGTDSVEQNVYKYTQPKQVNPYQFNWPIYDPRAFTLKFNGYDLNTEQEHWLYVDLKNNIVKYSNIVHDSTERLRDYKIIFSIRRNGQLLFPVKSFIASNGVGSANIPEHDYLEGDVFQAELYKKDSNGNFTVKIEDHPAKRVLSAGSPFTIAKAGGSHLTGLNGGGTYAYYDGVALFDHKLSPQKMSELSFINTSPKHYIQQVRPISQQPDGNNYQQQIEVTYLGNDIPENAQLKFTYKGHSTIEYITNSPQTLTLRGIPYESGRLTDFGEVSIKLLNGNDVLSEWKGKRFFRAPRSSQDLM